MNKNILLIGGTGTLSNAVLMQALKENYSITIMNRGHNNKEVPLGVEIVKCDFKDKSELMKKFNNCNFDVVVDFLSRNPSDIERVFPIFRDRCRQYIFISSACVYRRNKEDFPITESSPKPNKSWSYNIEKYNCEKRLIELSENGNSYYTIIRPYITYNAERIPLGISPSYKCHKTIIERIKKGKPWFVWDEGKAVTTLTFTEDFAVGVVGLFLNEKAKNTDFHVVSDFCYTQKDVVKKVFEKLGMPLNVISIPSKNMASLLPEYSQMLLGDRVLDAIFDNSKIKQAVPHLKFGISLDEGLDRILEYWEKAPIMYDYQFEGRIDSVLSKFGGKVSFQKYAGAGGNAKILYMIYRYLPFKIANRLKRWIL